jgi:hypothetical protein
MERDEFIPGGKGIDEVQDDEDPHKKNRQNKRRAFKQNFINSRFCHVPANN